MARTKQLIVTTTYSRDVKTDHRFPLNQMMCLTATAFGYPVIDIDDSPDPEVARLLQEAGALVRKQREPGTGASRRECLSAGLDFEGPFGDVISWADVISWIEPEKFGMIPYLDVCGEMVMQGADIVIPWRRRLCADYPEYQAMSEMAANLEMAQITGRNLDLMCGPRIMSRRGAEILLSYKGRSRVNPDVIYDDNWGIIFVPILWALRDGLTVVSCTVDYIHPAIQTRIEGADPEMDRKRDLQRMALVAAMRREAELIGLKPAA